MWSVDCCGAVLVIRGEILGGERSGLGVDWREGWAGGPQPSQLAPDGVPLRSRDRISVSQ